MLAGACLGFLPHNFSPARIFMGDSGSMLVGLMLSAAAVDGDRGRSTRRRSTPRPACCRSRCRCWCRSRCSLIPFVDLLLAVVRRTRRGQSPFAPDKMHLHHRLLSIGHSHRRAVLVMYFWAALLSFGAVALSITGGRAELLVASASCWSSASSSCSARAPGGPHARPGRPSWPRQRERSRAEHPTARALRDHGESPAAASGAPPAGRRRCVP